MIMPTVIALLLSSDERAGESTEKTNFCNTSRKFLRCQSHFKLVV